MSKVEDSGYETDRRRINSERFEQRQASYDLAFPACRRLPHEKSWEAYCSYYNWEE